jgi:hypothetical protein
VAQQAFRGEKKEIPALAVKSVLFGAIASLNGAVEFGFGLKPKQAALSTGHKCRRACSCRAVAAKARVL